MFRSLFLTFVLAFPLPAFSQDVPAPAGQFTILEEGDVAPYGGVLFDVDATSYLLTLPKYYENKFAIECDFLLSQEIAKKDLEIEKLTIRLDTQVQQFDTTVYQKDLEITALQDALKKKQLIKPWMWGVIGGVVGTGVTIGIVRAVE